MDKYSKDHLNDIKNRKPLDKYRGYYIDKVYRKICYKNKNKVWMYARSVNDMPGHVYVYLSGRLIAVDERLIAHTTLGPYVPKAVLANTIITQVISEARQQAEEN